MNAAGAPQGNNNNRSQPHHQQEQPNSPNEHNSNNNPHVLSPKEAALRGAAMAFAKQKKPPPPPPPSQQQHQQQQQQQQQQTRNPHRQSLAAPSPNYNQAAPASPRDNDALSAATSAAKTRPSPAGSVSGRSGNTMNGSNGRLSRQTTGSSVAQERGGGGGGEELERERERLALFLSSPGSEQQQPRSSYHSSPAGAGGNNNNTRAAAPAAGPRSASFIAATLAASRSASPNPAAQVGGGGDNGNATSVRRSHLGEPANIQRRRRVGSVGTSSSDADFSTTSSDDHPDTTSLAPTTSLISMFEVTRRGNDGDDADPIQSSPDRRVERKAKPPVPKALKAVADEENVAIKRPEYEERQSSSDQAPPALPERNVSASAKTRPEVPKKSTELPGKSPLELKRLGSRKLTRRPSPPIAGTGTDGQNSSKRTSPESTADARPSSAGSVSSNDSFVSASSTPTRAESPPVFDRASRSLAPRVGAPRPASTLPHPPTLPVRRTPTGSSSLTLDSLSDAIMAGSLASARHPTAPPSTTTGSGGSSRTPPPVPPSRLKGGKRNSVSTRRPSSPHRMKQTLRQPRSLSDDEEEKKPHHKKKLIGNKKHTHHEGSRSRWRNEITEREKKRYEAVWASNRGLFLVQGSQQLQQQQQVHTATATAAGAAHARSSSSPSDPSRARDDKSPRREQVVRTESYEELSEYVPNVVVRDLWSRSRLPAEELAEVWDLVYGGTGFRVHAALNKPEFVVGMWLVDQRLRGRKIPTRVSDSVWDSAKGLRVWSPIHGHPKK
ncbi:hypothetical protein VMCG_00164 [Cytospora schulzeri]|uniref:EH domain-containing protein n=1 Tax=Cytospora schulzeri TaxID=448051 RepID=A0A423X992_9PEZI|nr:hypothetical protein VMCG_00164 [Valsa malicola]